MSRRTAEANKAIRLAWEREQGLVQEGKGTRDWTQEQQHDILAPDKGKAYDEQGRAFEGQHMKSVAEYPEYQGNPDNIQFLSKAEHLEAHKGSWQNPTNWYYEPTTKEFTYFAEDEIIPCKVIELSDPVIVIELPESEATKQEEPPVAEKKSSEEKENAPPKKSSDNSSAGTAPKNKAAFAKIPEVTVAAKTEGKFVRGLKAVGKFVVEHPMETFEIVGTVATSIFGIASAVGRNSSSGNSNTHNSTPGTDSVSLNKTDIATKVAYIVEKANRATPGENDVSGHRQRYHTKDGVIWKDKAPYHRGGKDS